MIWSGHHDSRVGKNWEKLRWFDEFQSPWTVCCTSGRVGQSAGSYAVDVLWVGLALSVQTRQRRLTYHWFRLGNCCHNCNQATIFYEELNELANASTSTVSVFLAIRLPDQFRAANSVACQTQLHYSEYCRRHIGHVWKVWTINRLQTSDYCRSMIRHVWREKRLVRISILFRSMYARQRRMVLCN